MPCGGHHVGVIPLIVSQALGRLGKAGGSGAVTACKRTADKQDSTRIVAGTNLFIDGSPYSYLNYSEPMSTGRRIAREIKNALLTNNLHLVLDDSSVL